MTHRNTKVVIIDKDNKDVYHRLRYEGINNINFPYVLFGFYDITQLTVADDKILQLHFKYPELREKSEKSKKLINKNQ